MAELLEMAVPSSNLEPIEPLVARLRDLLRQAESGELRSFAYAGEYCKNPQESRERGVSWALCGERWNAALIGGLEILKADLAQETIRLSDERLSGDDSPGGPGV